MSVDYGEIICNAVDEIITSKLQGLQYDITKLCTIVDDSMNHQGKYIVTDGTARYEAFTTDISLKKGNQVLVSIPNGDYNMTKTIKGRVASTDTTPFKYTSPIDTMIKITNNIFNGIRNSEDNGLLANGNKIMIGPLWSLSGVDNLTGYTRLGIAANFRSWLNGLDVVSGSYGIKVLVRPKTNNEVYELTFSSTDMVGNPYLFEDYFYQEKVFDVSQIENIQDIEIYFYQDGNFKNGQNELIKYPEENYPNNLFVDGVKIYLGYDMNDFNEETLTIFTPDKTSYRYNDEILERNVYLRWIHKVEEKVFELIDENNFDESRYEVRWFRYSPGVETIDQYAGKNWERIEEANNFNCIFLPEVKKQREQIKVVGLIRGETENAYTPYFSNILTFENEELVPDQTTLEASTALSIYCEDNSEGNYFIYNQNGKISNENAGKERSFKAMYQGSEIDLSTIGTVNYIEWWFPKNEKTMLITNEEMWNKDNGQCNPNELISYRGVDYIRIRREPKNGDISLTQDYTIASKWNWEKSNNTVICRVSINGIEYQALEELRFGKAGTNGTKITFLIEFSDNENALPIAKEGETSTINVYARLYANGDETVNGIPENADIKWEWYRKSNNNYINLSYAQSDNHYCKLSTTVTSVPDDNFYVLKAIYKYNDADLEAFLPIPIKNPDYAFIEGAKEVIYDHQGIPNYYDGPYIAYDNNKNKVDSNVSLVVQNEAEDIADTTSLIGRLMLKKSPWGGYGLSANSLYIPEDTVKNCVNINGVWAQPILVMQGRYDFAMLNDWDETFKIDEKQGTILSTMLGAGRKNSDNTYSGVLIGDIKKGTDLENTSSQTGVYGLDHGVISYALKEDGTATFGAEGKGQININGNSGTIKSAGYSLNNGTKLDLNEGTLDINFAPGRILIEPKDPYLFIRTREQNNLIQIGQDESYIQSNNFAAMNGTKLDLANGDLDIRSSKGHIYASGSGNPYFKIGIPSNDSDQAYANNLFLISDNDYYLKSQSYVENEYIKVNGYNTYKQPDNSIVDISSIVAISPAGNVYKVLGNTLGDQYVFQGIKNVVGEGEGAIDYSQTAEQVKQTYISQLIPNLLTTQASKGFKLDLSKNTINGYDLYLKGTNTVTGKTFLLDSGAPELPLMIGEKFNVSWDGVLTCNKFNVLSTDGTTDNAISINNNFYVTKSGGAGGGSANFGYGGFGGLSCGTLKANDGNIKGLTVDGPLTVKGLTTTMNLTLKGSKMLFLNGSSSLSVIGGVALTNETIQLGTNVFKSTPITSSNGIVYTVLGHT